MRDISRKYPTLRTAVARAVLHVPPATLKRIQARDLPKGDPLEAARIAAIQAAKSTSTIIPFCHPLPIEFVGVDYETGERSIEIQVTVKAIARTGVEMEALTAASVAALTLYDMTKMLEEGLSIGEVSLLSKKGGKSDFGSRDDSTGVRAAVLVASDSVAAGDKSDRSGRMIVERLEAEGIAVSDYTIVPDEPEVITEHLIRYADEEKLELVLTTGGTGFSPRDRTPEAMEGVFEREIPGIPEATRAFGLERTPFSMLSRGRAGLRGRTLIINLPGSRGGVAESLDSLFPALLHAVAMQRGGGH